MASVLEHRVLSLSAVLSLCCSLSILQLRVGGEAPSCGCSRSLFFSCGGGI